MIDFENADYLKLKPVDNEDGLNLVQPMLVDGETVFAAFKSVRDMVVFTTKRVIAVNVQGMTGAQKDFTSLPYKRVQVFSVETAGPLDLDCEMELWFSGVGKVRFEFRGNFDIRAFNRIIGQYIL